MISAIFWPFQREVLALSFLCFVLFPYFRAQNVSTVAVFKVARPLVFKVVKVVAPVTPNVLFKVVAPVTVAVFKVAKPLVVKVDNNVAPVTPR